MGEEKIEEIIRRIEEAIDGKREIEEVRKSDTLKFFLAVLENLKDWIGIEEVKNWIDGFLKGRKKRVSKARPSTKNITIEYKNKFFFSEVCLPLTKESEDKRVTDYLVFKWRENKEIWFGITIPLPKKEVPPDKKIKIGFYIPSGRGKGKASKNRQFNEEAKKLNLWEEMDIEISQEFPQKVAEKMGEILEEGIKKEEKLKELANKLFNKRANSKSPKAPGNEEDNKNDEEGTRLSSILNAIQTKPFLILAGISGTGKTQIARLIASVMSEEEIIAETMSEEEIKEIIKNIMDVIEKPNRKNIEKARSSDTLKFFLSVIENLKKEKWSGIEKVKEWLNGFLDGKLERASEGMRTKKDVNVEYNKKFVFDTLQLPFTGKERKIGEPREAVDYLFFKWKKYPNAWFGVSILKKKKEKNIRIGFYSYAKGSKGIEKFKDKMKELNLYEEIDLEISETFPQKVARKMEELLEKGIKNQKDIEELCNKLFGQEKKT